MNTYPLRLEIDGCHLDSVPAIHFRLAFAEVVNRLCYDPATRPKAIAVELGPATAAAAAGWLREVCAGPGAQRTSLPCMLGITKPNLRIRASARERALSLQRATGRDIHELPLGLLKDDLGYSALSVLYLSPTDSIIEAIRCAIELGVPLYGVDLEESAEAKRAETFIEDPSRAAGDINKYIKYITRNALYAEGQRDEEIDHRREVAMAARLKTVLAQHGHILFTGGIAHWTRLERMLRDPALRPAPIKQAGNEAATGFRRVVVHPLLAIYHLDVFPDFAAAYEDLRNSVARPRHSATLDTVDVVSKFMGLLTLAYEKHFSETSPVEQLDRRLEDLEAQTDFERLMANLCLLDQTHVPNLFTAMIAAQGTMSPRFCELLAEVLMYFKWASPTDFPELPVLAPAPAEVGDDLRGELLEPDSKDAKHWHRRQWVYVHSSIGRSGLKVKVKVPWEWEAVKPPTTEGDSNFIYCWPPITRLLTAMSFRARRIASSLARPRVKPFVGELCEGIDIKATLRAQAQGDDQIFVRDVRRQRNPERTQTDDWDPVIWLFRLNALGGSWDLMADPLEDFLEYGYARDPDTLQEVAAVKSAMIEQIGFGRRSRPTELPDAYGVPPALRLSNSIRFSLDLHGVLLYTPAHFDIADNCAFAENTKYRRNPFCTYPCLVHSASFPPPVREMFRDEYHLNLDLDDWPNTMVRMAIPFAQRSVTVIAPDGFSVSRAVSDEARRQGKTVEIAPQSYLPRETLRRISLWHGIAALPGAHSKKFDPEFERIFGEPVTANSHLLSPYWLDYATQSRKPHHG